MSNRSALPRPSSLLFVLLVLILASCGGGGCTSDNGADAETASDASAKPDADVSDDADEETEPEPSLDESDDAADTDQAAATEEESGEEASEAASAGEEGTYSASNEGVYQPISMRDTDRDGTSDHEDDDDDGDGYTDIEEGEGKVDTDSDGLPDSTDSDSDGDGLQDADEPRSDADEDGNDARLDRDQDGDGCIDGIEGAAAAADPTDSSACDEVEIEDRDSDGIPDGIDRCPDTHDNGADSDGDTVPDACDNCEKPNKSQTDADNDGVGDACQLQSNETGVEGNSCSGAGPIDPDIMPVHVSLADAANVSSFLSGFMAICFGDGGLSPFSCPGFLDAIDARPSRILEDATIYLAPSTANLDSYLAPCGGGVVEAGTLAEFDPTDLFEPAIALFPEITLPGMTAEDIASTPIELIPSIQPDHWPLAPIDTIQHVPAPYLAATAADAWPDIAVPDIPESFPAIVAAILLQERGLVQIDENLGGDGIVTLDPDLADGTLNDDVLDTALEIDGSEITVLDTNTSAVSLDDVAHLGSGISTAVELEEGGDLTLIVAVEAGGATAAEFNSTLQDDNTVTLDPDIFLESTGPLVYFDLNGAGQ